MARSSLAQFTMAMTCGPMSLIACGSTMPSAVYEEDPYTGDWTSIAPTRDHRPTVAI